MVPEKAKKGRLTLPVEEGMNERLKEIAKKWGADAVRNSDGTELPETVKDFQMKVYSTLCPVRHDQKWIKAHPETYPQKALMTDFETALDTKLEIDLIKGYSNEQFAVDTIHDAKEWFEVVDRTTGEVVEPSNWAFDKESGVLTINNTQKFHTYTVSFLVHQIWDTTSMYNHIVNNWTSEHISLVDPRQPEARKHVLELLEKWLNEHPETDVVRLTSLAYHFTNNFTKMEGDVRTRYVDWAGYHDCTSVSALNEFEKEYGYRLTPGDLTDQGFMNDVNRIPSTKYFNWMDFIQRCVTDISKEWVDIIHKHGREAMTFLGDHWIGAEPYGKHFPQIGLDAIVGACMRGVDLRRVADIPVSMTKEVRLHPYFFPLEDLGTPTFMDGGNPTRDCKRYWRNIRRAVAQSPPDRIGFGGYLSLAAEFPDFIEYVAQLSDEFRSFHEVAKKTSTKKWPFKVAILNCWGKLRSWMVSEFKTGVLECLSGMSVDVEFISFDDILKGGIPEDVNIIINMGDAKTSWSGGYHWENPNLVTKVRQWVYNGGGFVGIGDPTATEYQGKFFQLHDVLGVDKELGYSISAAKPPLTKTEGHFILEDESAQADLGTKKENVFRCPGSATKVLMYNEESVHLSVNEYGQGRSVYLAGLAFSTESVRLLTRIFYWVTKNENEMKRWFSTNPNIECAVYPEVGKYILMNYSYDEQKTTLFDSYGNAKEVILGGSKSQWFDI